MCAESDIADFLLLSLARRSSKSIKKASSTAGKTLRSCPLAAWDGLLTSWSPDGKQVAFGSSGDNPAGIWLLDVQTGRRTLIAGGLWTMPVWSPDASKFTFQYRRPGQRSIWIVDAKDLAKLKPWQEGQ